MKPFKGIASIRALSGHELEVVFKGDRRAYRVDLAAELAASPALAPLRDPALFASVRTIDLDTAIAWADDLDMCGDHLWRLAHEQAGSLMPRDAFRAWRARHGLSLAAAAEALGVPRRMVAGYDSGERPIPKTVRLACLGWEAAQRPEQAA